MEVHLPIAAGVLVDLSLSGVSIIGFMVDMINRKIVAVYQYFAVPLV